jgi:Tfp pilus assembly protein PilF
VAPAIVPPVSAPPPTPAVASPDQDEVAALLARARTYLAAGDVAAARLVLRRAAERDDAQAALALGGTFDPIVLKRLGIVNFHADPTQAQEWYRKAAALGSPDASLRLEQLVQTDR